jgi:hypothetical protein
MHFYIISVFKCFNVGHFKLMFYYIEVRLLDRYTLYQYCVLYLA